MFQGDLCFRMEKVNSKKLIYQVKVMGTLVTVGGAMLMTLYKGPIVEMVWSKHAHSPTSNTTATHDKDWVKGSILVILATLAWSALFIIQVKLLSRQEPNTPFSLPLLTLDIVDDCSTRIDLYARVFQKITLKHYSPLSLTTLICFVGTLQSTAVTLVMEHKASAWHIGWDMNLLAAAYAVSFLLSLSLFYLNRTSR